MLLGHQTYELSFEMELRCSLCPFYATFQNVEDTLCFQIIITFH